MQVYAPHAHETPRGRSVSTMIREGFSPASFHTWRVVCGLSRADVQRLAQVSAETVRRWEENLSAPTVSALAQCVRAVVDHLWEDERLHNYIRNVQIMPRGWRCDTKAEAFAEIMGQLIRVPQAREKFSTLRNLAGMSQQEAATAGGLSARVYGQYERGEKSLTDEQARVFAQVFRVPVDRVKTAHERTQRRKSGEPA